MLLSRRSVMTGTAALALTGAAGIGRSSGLAPTSRLTMGPFYPATKPVDRDADLTRLKGARGSARGQPINVLGRVFDARGHAIAGARLKIWQANAAGRYAHPGDAGSRLPLDPNFQGYAAIITDKDGRFRFRTVKPGAYPVGGGRMRTPHIHFAVSGRSDSLTSQMFFPGEPLNDSDGVLPFARDRDTVFARSLQPLTGDEEALAFQWDIVLRNG